MAVRVQVVVLLVLFVGIAVAMAQSPQVLGQSLTLTLGDRFVTLDVRAILLVFAGALLFLWLAGLADVWTARRDTRAYRRALAARDDELARLKAEAFDRDRPLLADVRARLDAVEADMRDLGGRVEEGFASLRDRAVVVEERPLAPVIRD